VVRQMAAHLLGRSAQRRSDVCQILEQARDHDPDPVVRKIAGWYAPGGSIYRRLSPGSPKARGRQPRRRPRPGSLLYSPAGKRAPSEDALV
jgi:hypothetical protein